MIYCTLADLVLALYLVFILFVLPGGLFTLVLEMGASFAFPGYPESFVEHYLVLIIYPVALSPPVQIYLAGLVVVVNLLVYWFVWRRREENKRIVGVRLKLLIGVDFFGWGHYSACLLMYLDQFHQKTGDAVHIEPEQGSRFAKEIAGDFNPLHNPDNKRFCVPGDLLFSLVLANYGISPRMSFRFKAMVGKGTELLFPANDHKAFDISDSTGKCYMEVERDGEAVVDANRVEMLSRSYVAFSGNTFPSILVPLLEKQQTMINPDRPLVIYERMHFELARIDFSNLDLRLHKASLDARGKRGGVALDFTIYDGEEKIGSGRKQLLIGGLTPFDPVKVKRLAATYAQWKADYENQEPFSVSPASSSV